MPLTNTEHPTELDNDDLGIDIDMAVENVHNESTSEEKKRVKVIDSNDEEDSIELLTQAIEKSNIAAKDKRRLLEMVEFKGPLPPPSLLLQYDKLQVLLFYVSNKQPEFCNQQVRLFLAE